MLVMFVGKGCERTAAPPLSIAVQGDRSDMAPSLNTEKCECIAAAQKDLASSIIDSGPAAAAVVAEGSNCGSGSSVTLPQLPREHLTQPTGPGATSLGTAAVCFWP